MGRRKLNLQPQILRRRQNGEVFFTFDYYVRLKNLVGMTPDERKEWYYLGVHLTENRERRLECLGETCAFFLQGIA